jgi:hypothetical protein
MNGLSVVVPVAPGDESWRGLLVELARAGLSGSGNQGHEILLVGVEAAKHEDTLPAGARWLAASCGRGRQLNAGAAAASGRWLWFLHADSRLEAGTVASLEHSLRLRPGAMHFFDLCFLGDGPALMRVNDAGVWIRSRLLRMPFGDQGFCVSREIFGRLGGFPEDAPYGEDHLFVWRARRAGVPLLCTGGVLRTSARKYREGGWLRTTARHIARTWKQAIPEILRLRSS